MIKSYPFTQLQEKVSSSGKILVALPKNPSFDQVAAGLGLFLTFQEAGKTVFVTCPTPMTVEFNHLVAVDKIAPKAQGTDLIISFNYPSDQVEKVSYNDDSGRPNLVVQVKVGAPVLDTKAAAFSYGGINPEMVVAVGIEDPQEIAATGADLASSTLICLLNKEMTSPIGQINIVDPNASYCEIALGIISGLNFALGVDSAQNALAGIWRETKGLTAENVGADTYEAVALCLRAGGQRPVEVRTTVKKEERTEVKLNNPSKPPADWLEPKIYRGTNIS